MKFRPNKNLIARTILCLSLFIQLLPFQTARAFSCDYVSNKELSKGFIITILEEEIGTIDKHNIALDKTGMTDKNGSIICVRNYRIDPATNNQSVVYASTCEADTTTNGGSCKKVQVIYAQSGPELLYSYIGLIYRWAAGTIGIVSVFFIVLGGVQISASGSNSEAATKAKERITASLIGLVMLFLSGLILYTINPIFFVTK